MCWTKPVVPAAANAGVKLGKAANAGSTETYLPEETIYYGRGEHKPKVCDRKADGSPMTKIGNCIDEPTLGGVSISYHFMSKKERFWKNSKTVPRMKGCEDEHR